MLRKTISLIILASLAACASKPLPYGNFIAATPDGFTEKVTSDMVTQIVATFPPAATRLSIQHPTADGFGAVLVESLRIKGFALQEFEKSANQSGNADLAQKPPGLPFSYVVDGPIADGLFRVTMTVGDKTFSRAYALDPARNVTAASAWTRKD